MRPIPDVSRCHLGLEMLFAGYGGLYDKVMLVWNLGHLYCPCKEYTADVHANFSP